MYKSKHPLSVHYLTFSILVAFRCANYNKLPEGAIICATERNQNSKYLSAVIFVSPRPLWGGTFFVLSECSQDNSKSNGAIYMKYGGIVDIHTRTNPLDFDATSIRYNV